MSRRTVARPLSFALLVMLLAAGCGSMSPVRRVNSALDFLYPEGAEGPAPPAELSLRLPLHVGIAFAPNREDWRDPIPEGTKRRLLEEVAAAFRAEPAVAGITVIPTAYLQPGGGFANVDRLRSAFGIDLVALVSYDQTQFSEATRASWTYLTVVGAMLVEGEKNDTRTVMDAVVYDIRSRALLFRAAGESTVKGRSNPYTASRERRTDAAKGFEAATDELITDLRAGLEEFDRQARTGTVRGPGTPAIAMYDRTGERISATGGAGALDLVEIGALVVLAAALGTALPQPRRRTGR